MQKTVNEVKIIGRLFSYDLKEAEVKNPSSAKFGQSYINGTVNIATDDAGMNIVPITYVFVQSVFGSGKPNSTYAVLKKLIDGGDDIKTVSDNGIENATIVEASKAAISLDDRYVTASNEYKSYVTTSGGFLSIRKSSDLPAKEEDRNSFDTDIVITKVTRVPEDADKNIKDHSIVHGAIFGYGGVIYPMDFKVTSASGMDYFEGLGASNANPVFTKIHGQIVNNRQVIQTQEQTAFGAPIISTTTKITRDRIITSAIASPYVFGQPNTITAEELTKAMQDREIYLAKVKKDAEDYAATKSTTTNAVGGAATGTSYNPAAAPAKAGQFLF